MSGQSDSFRALLTTHGEWFTSNDCPKIGEYDELLEALKREHGEAGRPDLQPIPRTTMTPTSERDGRADPGGKNRSARPQLPSERDVEKIDIMRVCRRADGNGMGVLRDLRRDRLGPTQGCRRVCDHARDYRLGLAVDKLP